MLCFLESDTRKTVSGVDSVALLATENRLSMNTVEQVEMIQHYQTMFSTDMLYTITTLQLSM